jgi:hypothetical protein
VGQSVEQRGGFFFGVLFLVCEVDLSCQGLLREVHFSRFVGSSDHVIFHAATQTYSLRSNSPIFAAHLAALESGVASCFRCPTSIGAAGFFWGGGLVFSPCLSLHAL